MKQHLIITLLLCLLLPLQALAGDIKRPDSYNYNRALEAINANKIDEAISYLHQEIAQNPKNGYAYSWMAFIKASQQEYGSALSASDWAVKYLPSKDTEYVVFAYTIRGRVYYALGELDKSLADYSQVIKASPNDPQALYNRAQVYFDMKKYDLADRDYHKMIDIDHGSVMGYMGLGRDAHEQKRYDQAIKMYDYAIKLDPDYPSGYSFRASTLREQGKFTEAIDDVVKALSISRDQKAYYNMLIIADTAYAPIKAKLKVMATANPTDGFWPFCLAEIAQNHKNYREAIAGFWQAYKLDGKAPLLSYIADNYDNLGDYDRALSYIDKAIAADSTNHAFVFDKGFYLDHAGRSAEAIATLTRYISLEPGDDRGYYWRGWVEQYSGSIDAALDDMNMAVTLDPDYAYAYLNRGFFYQMKGRMDLAKPDFEKCIALDTVPGGDNCAPYAYLCLGQRDKAISALNEILKLNDSDDYYDVACLYSLLGDEPNAFLYLEKALQNGFYRYDHVRRDRDLANLRTKPAFEQLLKKCEALHKQELAAHSTDDAEQR